MPKKFGAVVVAAGSSSRMGGGVSKVLLPLGGKPVLQHSLETLSKSRWVEKLAVVCREEDKNQIAGLTAGLSKPCVLVNGGKQRQDSVLNGVLALDDCEYLLIHDGARPLITEELIHRICKDALEYQACSPAVRAKDTYKLTDPRGFVTQTPERDRLMAVQTPQAFLRSLYLTAVQQANEKGISFTDDCQLIEAAGGRVHLLEGDYRNLKITTPEDLLAAQAYWKGAGQMRVGNGYDVHRLAQGRKLILAGVEVPFSLGLLGHSDADVLTHAVADALLGAAALGDIGKLFPDTDPQYTGADSLELLKQVCEKLREAGFSIENIDATLIAQRPKIAPYIPQMRENLAGACSLEVGRVSVKATTEEGLGFTGEGLGMAAHAVCLIS